MGKIINVKCQPRFFEQTIHRNKEFEIRFNDKDYQVGDTLHQREWIPDVGYTGRIAICHVTFVLKKDGYVGVGCWFERMKNERTKELDHE